MEAILPTAHVAATCAFCRAGNTLTIQSANPDHQVTCATCGGLLGTVGELHAPAPAGASATAGPLARPRAFA